MSFRDSLPWLRRSRPTLRDSVLPTRARLASGCAVPLSRTGFGFPYLQGHFRKVSVLMLCHLHFPFPQAFFPGATALLTKEMNPYVLARAGHAALSDEAVFKKADHQDLSAPQRIVARNMISSFLQEMAWDLGQRRLLTNARNYTSFLVNAARGFEEVCSGSADKRVFYLTHTVVTPGHLLNWPTTEFAIEQARVEHTPRFRICRPNQFMLEYMSYCRYFARTSGVFLHGRLISVRGETPQSDPEKVIGLSNDPFKFGVSAIEDAGKWSLPVKCSAWGIPSWSKLAIRHDNVTKALRVEPHGWSFPTRRVPAPAFEEAILPQLFATSCGQTYTPISSKDDGPNLLHWPLFHKDAPDTAGQPPDIHRLGTELLAYILNNATAPVLLEWVEKLENGKALVKRALDDFTTKIRGISDWANDGTPAAHSVLHAYERLQRFRWAFQQNAAQAYDDLCTATLLLVNVILSNAENKTEQPTSLVSFKPWFEKTFHTNPKLAMWYDVTEALCKGAYHNQEFALIGVIDLAGVKHADIDQTFVASELEKWRSKATDNRIRELVGLTASIRDPWEHATMRWLWDCSMEGAELHNMVNHYCAASRAARHGG